VTLSSGQPEPPAPWGNHQPKFERLEYEEPRRFFLVGKLAPGDRVRVRMTAGSYEQESPR
jgi:hypothetical protein